jgi:hypothetical protein
MAEFLGAYALEPFYDEVLAELGAPPLGVPHELTAEYAWAKAHEKVEAENRAAARLQEAEAKRVEEQADATPVKKAPAKRARRAPVKKAPATTNTPPTVAERIAAVFGK